ncbi:MAG: hypothetical protein Q4E87_05470 [bacterium]|nr:hypothetical protein [bacterium]
MQVFKKNIKLRAVKQQLTVFDKSKFTVVGTPTITNDGLSVGFSSGSYIKITDLDFSKPWVFEATENVSSQMAGVYGGANGFNVQPQAQTGFYFILKSLNSGNLIGAFDARNKEKVCYRVSWDGSVYKLEMKADDDQTYTIVKTFESTQALTGTLLVLGYNSNAAHYSNVGYDLKDVRFISGGVEVFSGTKTTKKLFAVNEE